LPLFNRKLYLSFKSHQYEYKFIVGAMFFVPRISGFDSLLFSSSVELLFFVWKYFAWTWRLATSHNPSNTTGHGPNSSTVPSSHWPIRWGWVHLCRKAASGGSTITEFSYVKSGQNYGQVWNWEMLSEYWSGVFLAERVEVEQLGLLSGDYRMY